MKERKILSYLSAAVASLGLYSGATVEPPEPKASPEPALPPALRHLPRARFSRTLAPRQNRPTPGRRPNRVPSTPADFAALERARAKRARQAISRAAS